MELQILGILILLTIFVGIFLHFLKNFNNIKVNISKEKTVLLYDKTFQYDTLNLNLNDKIIFRNVSLLRHNVTTKDMDIPNSPLLYQFDTHTVRFSKQGVYEFNMSLYDDIKPLIVIVK